MGELINKVMSLKKKIEQKQEELRSRRTWRQKIGFIPVMIIWTIGLITGVVAMSSYDSYQDLAVPVVLDLR